MAAEILNDINTLVQNEVPPVEEVTDKLMAFSDAVAEGGPEERELALGVDGYTVVSKAWAACCYSGVTNVISPGPGVPQCRDAVLRALYSITAGNPEIIEEVGWEILSQAIDKPISEETHILALRVIRNVCIKSEGNREHFTWQLGLMDPLVAIIIKDKPTSALVEEWCATMKALVLSDDSRVVYNRAPERKRLICQSKVLPIVAGLLSNEEYEKNAGALNAIAVFLATMALNEDMCVRIESGNVLPGIDNIFKNHFQNKTLLRNAISLLRYLCVDLGVREKCAKYTFMKYILDAINNYKNESDVIDVAMSCCAMITLSNACQSSQFVTKNGLNLAFNVMNDFKEDMTILKGCCFTLRNVLENGGSDAKEKVKQLGFPEYLSGLLSTAPDLKEFYLMPVLRELGHSEKETTEADSTQPVATDKTITEETSGAADDTSTSAPVISHPDEETTDGFGEAVEEHM